MNLSRWLILNASRCRSRD